jgi:ATP-dependent RNA helicase RhlE
MTFADFQLNKQLLNAIEALEFSEPTPIQEKAIPVALAGHDLLGIAQTGTGKTAAYLLPILMKVKYAQGMYPRALIMAPTRELAMQIDEHISLLGQFTDIRHLAVYGGLGPKTQKEKIAQGMDIIVATPGRLMDLYLGGDLVLKDLKIMVLDEADKMMDMGFMPQIRRLLEVIPRKRQNMLFSATMPDKVLRLSEEFLEHPTTVEVSESATAAETVAQELYEVPNFKTKVNLLMHFLHNKEEYHRVIVFVRTKTIAENIFRYVDRKIMDTVKVIHANKGQNTRINSMEAFKEGNVRVLVATDVAARGLDILKVSHVFNFDVPVIYEDYVHRIGRTGRAKEIGKAITFMQKAEAWHIEKIEKIIRMPIPRFAIPEGVTIADTPFDEEQTMLREMDNQRKKDDPTFQGAFHEKKDRGFTKPAPKVKAAAKPKKEPAFKTSKMGGKPLSEGRRHAPKPKGKKFK